MTVASLSCSSRRRLARPVLWCLAVAGFFTAAAGAQEPPPPMYRDVPLPETLGLCGEPMPLDRPAVREMLDRELTIAVWDHAQVFMWLKRAGRDFPVIEKQLAEHGMPDDLKYLAVAESSLLTHVESPMGAVGPWQMIRETGVRHGLRSGELVDERVSLEHATAAALRYLRSLHDEFGSWMLAAAAYNCGEARVRREIEAQKVDDYYRLNLPLETERFVFRIAAIKLIMENPARYGYCLPEEHVYRPVSADAVQVKLERPLHITDVAAGMGVDFKTLRELNAELTGYYLPAGSYRLRVPKGLKAKATAVIESLSKKPAK